MSPANTIPTFEEVDKHIQGVDLSVFDAGGKLYAASATASPAAAIPNICAAYRIIRPILALVSNVPLIPTKWRDAIKAFMGVMDTLCP